MKLQSDVKFTQQQQLDEMSTVGQRLLALPVSSNDEAHYITRTHATKRNHFVLQGHTGMGILASSTCYEPVLAEGIPAPKLSPSSPCSNLIPVVQHIVGSAVLNALA